MPMNMDMGDGTGSDGAGDQNMADVMFVQMMIPHHQQAVEMSDLILGNPDVDPEVAALAEQIKAAQDPEIELMMQWLEDWGVSSMGGMEGMDGMSGMDGMMSDEQLASLESASGPEASTLFLELMIEHHQGAITMAEDVIANGQSAQVRDLAEQIITSQTAEIDTMNELLSR
ncbi:MAG: DUF305 domain-containing protein [Microbacteriaceae bacterium]|nr:DUF305 domain-containing protein [Microbacteriaceae bacterium]